MTNCWNDCPLCGHQLCLGSKKYFANFANIYGHDIWLTNYFKSLACPKCKNYAVVMDHEYQIKYQCSIVDNILVEFGNNHLYMVDENDNNYGVDFIFSKYALNPKEIKKLMMLF